MSGLKEVIDGLLDDSDGVVLLMVQIGSNFLEDIIGNVVRWVAGDDILAFGGRPRSRGDSGSSADRNKFMG